MSTLLQLINEVLRRTGQIEVSTLTGVQTPTLQALDFLNETYVEMLQRLNTYRLQNQGSLTTSNATASYSLAADAELDSLLADSLLETDTQQRLQEVDATYPIAYGTTATGKPQYFYRMGSLLYLYPIPDGAYTIQFQYQVKPAALSADNDTTQLPAEWEKVLLLGAQARLENFLGESGENTYILYRDGLDQLKSRAPKKPHYRMKGFYRGNT